MYELNRQKIEKELFDKLFLFSKSNVCFTEIMKGLIKIIIDEKTETCNTWIMSKCMNILIHFNLHDLYRGKGEQNQCEKSIKSQFDLFFEFMFEFFYSNPNFSKILKTSIKNAKKNAKKNKELYLNFFLGEDNCLMCLKKLKNVQ